MNTSFKTIFAAAVVAAGVGVAGGASAESVRFMTGPQGGVWIPLGGALKDMFEKGIPGTSVQALPGAGIANVRGVEEGKTELGFGNSISTVDAIKGNAPFPAPHKNVCNVATLYPQYFQVVVPVDAKINSVQDLKGKALSTQPRGNTGEQATRDLLKAVGLTYNDVKTSFVSYTDSVTQLKDGHAQAFTLGTTIPSSAVMDLAAGRDIKLLDLSPYLDAMRKINPGYTLVNVPAGTYPKQDKDVKVIAYATHMVASCKLSEDTVYKMTKIIAENTAALASINKAIGSLTVQGMAEDIGVPFHPGAAKFYREKGVKLGS
ncbi:MAG TPA: TAXI family TRAP transporter solute-binding subunit [Alphaproteobacteria bacterium]|nr:TAXI family TRAP transporter solute-binding subunit [Alphaproteobacteria bacterium]